MQYDDTLIAVVSGAYFTAAMTHILEELCLVPSDFDVGTLSINFQKSCLYNLVKFRDSINIPELEKALINYRVKREKEYQGLQE